MNTALVNLTATLFDQLDAKLINKSKVHKINDNLTTLLEDDFVKIWMSQLRSRAETTLGIFLDNFTHNTKNNSLFQKFFYLVKRNNLQIEYSNKARKLYNECETYQYREWHCPPTLVALKQDCLSLPTGIQSVVKTPYVAPVLKLSPSTTIRKLVNNFLKDPHGAGRVNELSTLIQKLMTRENIKTFMTQKVNLDIQVLIETTMCCYYKETDLCVDLSTEFGRQFAQMIYFLDHDLGDRKLNGPGILMTSGNGIDAIFVQSRDVNSRFKQYMTDVFSQYVPSEEDVQLIEEIKVALTYPPINYTEIDKEYEQTFANEVMALFRPFNIVYRDNVNLIRDLISVLNDNYGLDIGFVPSWKTRVNQTTGQIGLMNIDTDWIEALKHAATAYTNGKFKVNSHKAETIDHLVEFDERSSAIVYNDEVMKCGNIVF